MRSWLRRLFCPHVWDEGAMWLMFGKAHPLYQIGYEYWHCYKCRKRISVDTAKPWRPVSFVDRA